MIALTKAGEKKLAWFRKWIGGLAQEVKLELSDYNVIPCTGNTKGRSITVMLTSCLTGLYLSVLQINTKNVSCHTVDSKPVKQEVSCTVIIPPFSIPRLVQRWCCMIGPVWNGWEWITWLHTNFHQNLFHTRPMRYCFLPKSLMIGVKTALVISIDN